MMQEDQEIKRQVREFYDQVGWQKVSDDLYQNARYEDLRPVARAYIHNCHLRVGRHLHKEGYQLLDAGSGPIQYPEYLEYSRGYKHRVCADISIVALKEARERIGDHGLFVVADVARLPFKDYAFDGAVSLHTLHHLPEDQHAQAYLELHRVLQAEATAVVVNGWESSSIKQLSQPVVNMAKRFYTWRRNRKNPVPPAQSKKPPGARHTSKDRKGTFVKKHNPGWLKEVIGTQIPLEIWVWRSLTTRIMRQLIHERWGGKFLLGLIYRFEERFPHFSGEHGAYPLIVLRKPE